MAAGGRADQQTTIERVGVGSPWRVVVPPSALASRIAAMAGVVEEPWASPDGARAFTVPASFVRFILPRAGRNAAVPCPPLRTAAPPETGINWSAADSVAQVYTTEAAWVRKLCRAGLTPRREPAGIGWEFDAPVSAIKVRPPRVPSVAQVRVLALMQAERAKAG